MKINTTIRLRCYDIIAQAVEDAIVAGYVRAHKHDENPPPDVICDEIARYVMNALNDLLDFGDE